MQTEPTETPDSTDTSDFILPVEGEIPPDWAYVPDRVPSTAASRTADATGCTDCGKPQAICVCATLTPADTQHQVLVLQHPREQDHLLGTVPLLRAALRRLELRIGLSWASLAHALGPAASRAVVPDRWALVFPRSAAGAPSLEEGRPAAGRRVRGRPEKNPKPTSAGRTLELRALPRLDGIVLLDGTWSQAKTLLYRNPWLLRLPRLSLPADAPSIYGRLRREPRRGHVSTLEAAVAALGHLGEPEAPRQAALRALRTLAQRLRDAPELLAGKKSDADADGGRRAKRRPPAARRRPERAADGLRPS